MGIPFDLENINPDSLELIDVAHALSNTCRFTGHTDSFYSVAQHSVMVSYLAPKEHAFVGLMHDFTEAYLTDLATPVKRLLPLYGELERKIWLAGVQRWNLPETIPPEVKEADRMALHWEANTLFLYPPIGGWCTKPEEVEEKVPAAFLHPLMSEAAELMFIRRYWELKHEYRYYYSDC